MKLKPVFIVNVILGLLLAGSLGADSTTVPSLPDEIINLTSDQIVKPKKSIEPYFPLRAKKDNVAAEVWIRFTFSNGKAVAPRIVHCSAKGYQLEKAAIMTFSEYDFSNLNDSTITEDRIFYTKIAFGKMSTSNASDTVSKSNSNKKGGELENTDSSVANDSLRSAEGDFVPVDIMPELILKAVPEYPRKALQSQIQGTVYLRVLVNEDGSVGDVIVQKTSGFSLLDDAASKAAAKCRFKPAIQNDKPVKVWVSFPYEFVIHR